MRAQRLAAKVAAAAFIELGADPSPPGPISAGCDWDFLHGHLEDRSLAEGDVVHIELTPCVSGYSARLMRCAVVRSATKELENAAALLRDLQDRQIAAMQPSAIAGDVDAILRNGVSESGLRASFENISGYMLGFYSHAGPRTSDFVRIFNPDVQWRLDPPLVFHMYASAQGSSLGETVLVTDNGPERLTCLPSTLIINH